MLEEWPPKPGVSFRMIRMKWWMIEWLQLWTNICKYIRLGLMSSVLCEISHDELPFPKSSRIQLIVYFLCCCSILVVTLHTMNFVTGYDPLDYGLIVTDYISIDVWSFIHTFTFVGLGFLVPGRMAMFFLFGALWEVRFLNFYNIVFNLTCDTSPIVF